MYSETETRYSDRPSQLIWSSAEQNISNFSALRAFRPAYENAKKVMGVSSGNGRSISDENDKNRNDVRIAPHQR